MWDQADVYVGGLPSVAPDSELNIRIEEHSKETDSVGPGAVAVAGNCSNSCSNGACSQET